MNKVENNQKKILIIGAGWYGCHIAKSLIEKKQSVTVFEKSSGVFGGASFNNQNRLHQGYHYPRCSKTREQSSRGFHIFKKKYPMLTQRLDYNIYAISNIESLIDYETYKAIMKSQGLKFEDITDASPVELRNVAGLLDCEEEYICPYKSADYFDNVLKGRINFDKEVSAKDVQVLKEQYDYVVDCTWGGILSFEKDLYYELCLYYIVKSEIFINMAITLMDGELFSIFPHGEDKFTLTGVGTIVRGTYSEVSEANKAIVQLRREAEDIRSIDENLMNLVLTYYPNFLDHFKFERAVVSMKTKFKSQTDSRYVKIYREDNYIGVLSGKIDTIFDAESMVNRIIFE